MISTSKPRYDWWPYVKGMIRRYPALKVRYEDLHTPTLTVAYSDHVGGGEPGRTTETIAIRELPSTNQREYEAVRRAIRTTERMTTGPLRLQIIRMVLWDNSHTLTGAASRCHVGEATAWRWHGDFIRLVAKNYGLLDEDDSTEPCQ